MKKLMLLLMIVSMFFGIGLSLTHAESPESLPFVAAAKKVRANVTGTGDTRGEAEKNAREAAHDVAGTYSFTVVRKNTTGSGKTWVCSMTIEYTEK